MEISETKLGGLGTMSVIKRGQAPHTKGELIKRTLDLVVIGFLLAGPLSAQGAEPTSDMRDLARMYASLEARNLKSFCAQMQTSSYAGYIGRVCQYSVQNNLKQPEDCSPENIAKEANVDHEACLVMPPAEFEEKVRLGLEGRKKFIKALAEQGIDGNKMIQDARAKIQR